MVYDFLISRNGKDKRFCLTADDDNSFYKRCIYQYGVNLKEIKILNIYNDCENLDTQNNYKDPLLDTYLLVNNLLTEKLTGLNEAEIASREAAGWTHLRFKIVNDIKIDLIKYRVKLYYLKNGKKKDKTYILLYK